MAKSTIQYQKSTVVFASTRLRTPDLDYLWIKFDVLSNIFPNPSPTGNHIIIKDFQRCKPI